MSENTPKRTKSEEEAYLEQLYRAMDTGDVPEGMVPPQLPSLNKSEYQFRKINVPVKERKTPGGRIITAGKALSTLYLGIGVMVFFSVLSTENIPFGASNLTSHAETVFNLLFWVFFIGTVLSGTSATLTFVLKVKANPVRKFWPFAVLAACLVFLVFVKR